MDVEFFTNVEEAFIITDDGIEPLKPNTPIIDIIDERIKELYPDVTNRQIVRALGKSEYIPKR